MTAFSSLTGRLLVAMPGIDDDRFRHAVILICAHDDEHAMGLRLDQPAPGVTLSEVLKKLDTPVSDAMSERAVLIGGPVERERGFVLHTDDWTNGDVTLSFGDGLALTGTPAWLWTPRASACRGCGRRSGWSCKVSGAERPGESGRRSIVR